MRITDDQRRLQGMSVIGNAGKTREMKEATRTTACRLVTCFSLGRIRRHK